MLRDFDSFGPEARDCALGHFGRSLPEIESLLGKASPDEGLRNELAMALWKYARADLDGQPIARVKRVGDLVTSLQQPARALLVALDRLENLYCNGDPAATDVALMLGFDLRAMRGQLGVVLAATVRESKGGRPPNTEYAILMARVGALYAHVTERRPTTTYDGELYSGKFFRVAELVDIAAAEAVGGEIKSNIALGKLLGRIFNTKTSAETQ
jgi:hypothetical protein